MFRGPGVDYSRLSAANRDGARAEKIKQIVADLEARTKADQQTFVDHLHANGGRVLHQYWVVNGCAVEVSAASAPAVTAHPTVLRIYPDEVCAPATLPIRTSTDSSHHRSDLPQAAGVLGEGVTVAIVDSGFDTGSNPQGRPHLAFYPNGTTSSPTSYGVAGTRIAATYQIGALPLQQEDTHGTAVTGVAAGARWSAVFQSDDGHAPRATMAMWSIADLVGGNSYFSTMTAAWQGVLAQRAQKRIVAANLSYAGTPDPMHPLSVAIDAAGKEDILVTVAAGNTGTSTSSSQIVNNGLSVGAVDPAKTVWVNSCRGPLNGTNRPFPDLVAQGVNVWMPWAEDETLFYYGSGTSFAAPQVVGAATMFRALSNESALVTRAAILATTESVAGQNPGLGRNDYGIGYLRTDLLIDVARGNRWLRSPRLYSTGTYSYDMPVVTGITYTLALAWQRQLFNVAAWSNLRLEVYNGAQQLALANEPDGTFERTSFVSPLTGTVQVKVTALSIEDPVGGVPVVVLCPGAREAAMAWKPSSHAVHPPARRSHAMAFDQNHGKTVLFGGESLSGALGDHWEFDGAAWQQRTISTPPARDLHAMAYDKVRGRVVLFGGSGAGSDTWEYDGFAWTLVSSVGPSPRYGHAMVYDEARGTVVTFGGRSTGGSYVTDTWAWNGTIWTMVPSALVPPPRSYHVMAYDAAHQNTVLYSGTYGAAFLNDTWILDATGWTQPQLTNNPPSLESSAAAYDASRKRVVVHGGSLSTGTRTDQTWEWNGTAWTDRTDPHTTHWGRSNHAMVFDSARRRIVQFGGNLGDAWTLTYGFQHDTWHYESTAPATALNYGIGCTGPGGNNTLTATSWPWIGNVFEARGTGLPSPSFVLTVSSASSTYLPLAIVLPQALPGCNLWVAPDIVDVVISMTGTAQSQFQIPYSPSIVGAVVFHQMVPFQVDASLSFTAITATNALRLTVGFP